MKALKAHIENKVFGMTWAEAQALFDDLQSDYDGLEIRCVWQDGAWFDSTKDLRDLRLNVCVMHGIVVKSSMNNVESFWG
jgi:hypothetical protein